MSAVDGLTTPVDVADTVSATAPRRGSRRGAGLGDRFRGTALPSRARWAGWLFALPALVMYAVFELYPIITAVQYSFFDWDGISVATPVGVENYVRVFTEPQLVASIVHAFILIIFFTFLPVLLALVVASIVREIRSKVAGAVARTLMFLPQIIPGAASAIAWTWMYSPDGAVNQMLRALGLGSLARPWLGDFTWALPAVGVIGTWLATGLCTLLLMAGIGKIDGSLYEAASLDGAGRIQQFRAITLPGLRQEIGVCITITIIAALASFDVVFMSTQGGPGYATQVPGVQVYQLAFTENRIGQSSALAVVLSLIVLAVILPIQRFFKEK
ncbi:carbohydrate ABC transporter permease [Terrabacter sp. MAHUQ-38]|uniref:carbohydrate ABC transporter permease n=1 Tax=unclassified Terrabacter TaxID=2630222 RepID=UPI00165E3EDE|nr:sugar ABC transporter permease [Terrabacter sp. MAHUQ-38]MBC9822160.1 sugar ABC transporter permease [Terrabacter sp. MAHUQ-38]